MSYVTSFIANVRVFHVNLLHENDHHHDHGHISLPTVSDQLIQVVLEDFVGIWNLLVPRLLLQFSHGIR